RRHLANSPTRRWWWWPRRWWRRRWRWGRGRLVVGHSRVDRFHPLRVNCSSSRSSGGENGHGQGNQVGRWAVSRGTRVVGGPGQDRQRGYRQAVAGPDPLEGGCRRREAWVGGCANRRGVRGRSLDRASVAAAPRGRGVGRGPRPHTESAGTAV